MAHSVKASAQETRAALPAFDHLAEVEQVLGGLVLNETQRTALEDPSALSVEAHQELARSIGMRTVLYTSGLRSLVLERRGTTELAEEAARQASRTLAMLNNFEAATKRQAQSEDDEDDDNIEERITLRSNQQSIDAAFGEFIQEHPYSGDNDEEFGKRIHGLAIIAPTGGGKSAVLGWILSKLGVGTQPNEQDPRPLTAVVVVPSVDLVNEYAGVTGDKTFIRFSGGLVPGRYFADEKNTTASVIVCTEDLFAKKFRGNKLDGIPVDIVAVDEVHHLTGPDLRRTIEEECTIPVFGATATPAYNTDKDVRRILSHTFEHGDLLTYTENGLTNGAQLLTLPLELPSDVIAAIKDDEFKKSSIKELERELVTEKAITLAHALVKEGRRGIIFCEAGNMSSHAQDIAERLSSMPLDDKQGTTIDARAIGYFNNRKENMAIREAFDDGPCQVLTTAEMGREGVNYKNVDFVIIAVPDGVHSIVKLVQIIGRGTRLSDTFPITVFAEIFMMPKSGDDEIVSIVSAYGKTLVSQGGTIHKTGEYSSTRQGGQSDASFDITKLPEGLLDIIRSVDARPIRDCTVVNAFAEVEIPPEYSRPLSDIVNRLNAPLEWARRKLERAGYDYKSRREDSSQGTRMFVDYFKPEAEDYLADQFIPPRATRDHAPLGRLAHEENAPRDLMAKIIEEYRIPAEVMLGVGGKELNHYSRTAVHEAIESIPRADEHDVTYADLKAELEGEVLIDQARTHNSTTIKQPLILMRRHNNRGFAWYVPPDVAKKAWKAYYEIQPAESTDMNVYQMARAAGVIWKVFANSLTPADRESAALKRRDGHSNLYWPADVAADLIARNKVHQLGAHMIPLVSVADGKYIKATLPTVNAFALRNFPDQVVRLRLPAMRETNCVPWKVVQALEEKYGRASTAPEALEYDQLPDGPDDKDPHKRIYARGTHTRLLRPEQLNNIGSWEYDLGGIEPPAPAAALARIRPPRTPRKKPQPAPTEPTEDATLTPVNNVAAPEEQGISGEKISQLTGRSMQDVNEVIGRLGSMFLTPSPAVRDGRVMPVAYSGPYLDAILMELRGLTPEAIARRISYSGPLAELEGFLRGYTPVSPGRYGRNAVFAAAVRFKQK